MLDLDVHVMKNFRCVAQERLLPINVVTPAVCVSRRASLEPCILLKLAFRRRSGHISGHVFMTKRRSARADKTKKAAAHGFEKWYKAEEGKMVWGTIPSTLEDSPLYEAMQCTPHMVLRLQQCTACIQVRHSKVEGMGGEFYALLSAVWELRLGHDNQCANNDMQSVL